MRWLVFLLFVVISAAVPISVFDEQLTVNVKQFGAVGDGVANDTEAFSLALFFVSYLGGKVVVTNGTYLISPLRLQSNLEFHVEKDAKIIGPSYTDYWFYISQGQKYYYPLLYTDSHVENLTLSGSGVIDGRGSDWWVPHRNENRPTLLVLSEANHCHIQDLTLQNSPSFHVSIEHSANILIEGVNILAPSSTARINPSHNTDGIDPINSKNIIIRNCYINNGDDCIAIKEHVSNVLVEDSVFVNGHGASIGSLNGGLVANVTFRKIHFINTTFGARIKTRANAKPNALVTQIKYKELTMENVETPVLIDQFYEGGSNNDSSVVISDITFEDIYAKGLSKVAGTFNCSSYANRTCSNITLRRVHISNDGRWKNYTQCYKACQNIRGTIEDVHPFQRYLEECFHSKETYDSSEVDSFEPAEPFKQDILSPYKKSVQGKAYKQNRLGKKHFSGEKFHFPT